MYCRSDTARPALAVLTGILSLVVCVVIIGCAVGVFASAILRLLLLLLLIIETILSSTRLIYSYASITTSCLTNVGVFLIIFYFSRKLGNRLNTAAAISF